MPIGIRLDGCIPCFGRLPNTISNMIYKHTNILKYITRKINTLLFYCIFFFFFFECLFGRSIFEPIVRLRTISYILLFSSCLFIFQRKFPKKEIIFPGIFLLYYIIIGVSDYILFLDKNNITGFILYKQFFLLILLIYIFYNIPYISNLSFSKCRVFIIYTSGLFVIINTLAYFYDSDIWVTQRIWGRIGRGYPTLDVVTLSYSYAMLLMDNRIVIPSICRFLMMILLPIGIILQASGTGTVMLLFVMGMYIIHAFYNRKESITSFKSYTLSIFSILFIALLGFGYITYKYPVLATGIINNFSNRIEVLILGDSAESDVNTIQWREEQYENIYKKNVKSVTQKIFGIGFSKVNYSDSRNENSIYIENQYNLNLVTLGITGAILFILSLGELILFTFRHIIPSRRIMYISMIIIFVLSCYTIVPLQTFSVLALFAFFVAEIYEEKRVSIKHHSINKYREK